MTEEKRDTIGKLSVELAQKEPESRDPIELQRVHQKEQEFIENLYQCAHNFRKTCDKSFYVVVTTKREPLLHNVIRNLFFATNDCPTPTFDQSVWQYDKDLQLLNYLWTIPCREACEHLKTHALHVGPSEKELLQFVMDFYDGTLDKLANKLNGNLPDLLLTVQ